MAIQIVMDRTGDSRHSFNPHRNWQRPSSGSAS